MAYADKFHLFSHVHIMTLIVTGLASLALAWVARSAPIKFRKNINYALFSIIIANAVFWWFWAGIKHNSWSLPLHLCDLVIFLTAYSLLRHRQWVWDLTYFWTMGGTLHALITPDLRDTFPAPIYWQFFLTHGLSFIGVFYLSAGCGRPVYLRSLWRVWWATNAYAAAAGVINFILNTNFLYLRHKPAQPSLLDYLGPWPWYLVAAEGVFVITLFILYLPYALSRFKTVNPKFRP